MKRIVCMLTAVMLSVSLLTACQSKEKETYFEENSKGEIVDSSLLEKIEQDAQPLNTHISGDFKQHTVSGGQTSNITLSDKYAYIFWFMGDMGYIKVDLQTGEAIPLCDVAGCTHDPNDFPDCINNRVLCNDTAVGDELWYNDSNKLIAIKDGKEEVIYENKYCTKLEKDALKDSSDQKYTIFYFIVDDNYVYIFGYAYVVQIDRNTMKAVKTIDLPTEAMLLDPFIYNGSIYFHNVMCEAFKTDIESGETTKLGDNMYCICVKNDTLYYCAISDIEDPSLYSADLDLKKPEKLIENCYGDFVIKDNKIFYHEYRITQPDEQNDIMWCYDLDSGERETVYDGFSEADCIVAADFSDRLFFIGDYVNPDDTSEQYDVIASVRSDGSDLWVKKF